MKVSILTQPFHKNYGGILQNWALQQVLLRMGYEPLTFEHDTCYSRLRWLLRSAKQVCKRKSFASLPAYPYKGRIGHKPFIDFIVKNIRSVTVHHFTSRIEQRYKCDAIIVGSDQVWRPVFNQGRLYNMFLDFASDKVRKVAYAVSFGVAGWEYTEEETECCKALAKRFNAISIREDSGIDLCQQFLDVYPTKVLDPTLLLDKAYYMNLCNDIPRGDDSVFIYALHPNDGMTNLANKLASQQSLHVKIMRAGNDLHDNDSIEQWIAAFRDATAVVTDSFHGMALSIVFHKPFFAFKNESGGQERITSFLNQYGLSERLVVEGKEFCPKDIDWNRIDSINEVARFTSIEFLKNSLS